MRVYRPLVRSQTRVQGEDGKFVGKRKYRETKRGARGRFCTKQEQQEQQSSSRSSSDHDGPLSTETSSNPAVGKEEEKAERANSALSRLRSSEERGSSSSSSSSGHDGHGADFDLDFAPVETSGSAPVGEEGASEGDGSAVGTGVALGLAVQVVVRDFEEKSYKCGISAYIC